MIDYSMLQEFITEAGEHLDEMETDLLQLEVDPDNKDILNDIFREVHSIKGAAEYVGLDKTARLAHNLENLLELMRQGKTSVSNEIVDLLIEARDRMVVLNEDLERFKAEKADITDVLKLIRTHSGEGEPFEEVMGENPVSVTPETQDQTVFSDASNQEDEGKAEDETSSDHEIYEEEYDAELFEIFLQQLKENLSFIHTQTTELPTSENPEELLDGVIKKIESLKSSANYMGYERLVDIYENWGEEIRDAQEGLSLGEQVPFQFMKDFMDKILLRFPGVQEELPELSEEKFLFFVAKKHTREKSIDEKREAAGEPQGEEAISPKEIKKDSEEFDFDEVIEKELGFLEDEPESEKVVAPAKDPEFNQEVITGTGDTGDIAESVEDARQVVADKKDRPMASEERGRSLPEISPEEGEEGSDQEAVPVRDEPVKQSEEIAHIRKNNEIEAVELSDLELLLDNKKLYDKLDRAFDAASEGIYPTGLADMEEGLFTPVEDQSLEFSDDEPVEGSVEDQGARTDRIMDQAKSAEQSDKEASDHDGKPFFETEPIQTSSFEMREEQTEDLENEDPYRKEIGLEVSDNFSADIPEDIIAQRQKSVFGDRLIKNSLRVDARKIDSLMNQVGELVVSRAWFSQLFNEMREFQQYLKESLRLDKKEMKQVRGLTFRLSEATVNLGRVANELQEGIMKVRMLPISQLFNRYPRLVRDLVRESPKKVQLDIKGEDTELDKMIIEQISDPLVHIIRNAVDHGIEKSEERIRKGKSETGKIALEAYHESNHVVIEIKDDGRGIDPENIKARAVEKGFASREDLEQMTPKEIIALIMRPGFSTAGKITHTSGRGVGMDVVKKNVEKLNGTIEIDSRPGKETQFRIKIPLTLAIIAALLIRVGKDMFTIPLANVEETIRIFEGDITSIEGVEVIYLRNRTLPLVRLSEVFGISSATQDNKNVFVVVVSTGMRQVGLVVDSLIGQEEVVIKPLVDYLQESSGFSGATILGDGRISLILDVYELVSLTIDRRVRKLASGAYPTAAPVADRTRPRRKTETEITIH